VEDPKILGGLVEREIHSLGIKKDPFGGPRPSNWNCLKMLGEADGEDA